MGLRTTAKADAKVILEDGLDGFGWSVTLTDPAGVTADLTGFTNDISELIDPETGVAVSGRLASVAFSIETLTDAGFTLPEGISDKSKKPWIVAFDDVNGNPGVFKVARSSPDRALGIITLIVGAYKI